MTPTWLPAYLQQDNADLNQQLLAMANVNKHLFWHDENNRQQDHRVASVRHLVKNKDSCLVDYFLS
ncbi:hypothetical protein D3C77_339000 [compost metagenome]